MYRDKGGMVQFKRKCIPLHDWIKIVMGVNRPDDMYNRDVTSLTFC